MMIVSSLQRLIRNTARKRWRNYFPKLLSKSRDKTNLSGGGFGSSENP